MANTTTTTEKLQLEVGADIKPAMKEISNLQRHISTNMKKIQQSTGKLDKPFKGFLKQLQGVKTRSQGIKDLTKQLKALDKAVKDRGDLLAEARANVKKAKPGSRERKDAIARVKEIRKSSDIDVLKGARKKTAKNLEKLEGTKGFDEDAVLKKSEEIGEKLAEPLHDLLSKDAPRIMQRINKIMMGAYSKAGGVKDFGERLSKKGSDMMAAGGGKNKVLGGLAKGGGELTKMFGGLAKVMTSLGPILSVMSSFMASFIKVVLDAEAAAKDYNRQILATTGTASYLRKSFGNVRDATKSLDASLRAARDGAMDWSNIQWGISKETAIAFQSAVTAEGVALDRLGDATGDATQNAEAHAKSIQAAVAYSRAFGVSLSEIAKMQGELMSDLGMGAENVRTSFQTIVDGANEAGMETNKFFNIVRSFSSDLSLFTLRLAEVSKIMGVLGKTMDPRKMGQFLQTLNQKFSGGLMENVKFTVMAGGKGRQVAMDDAAEKLTNLSDDLKAALGPGQEGEVKDLIDLLKSPKRDPRKIAQWQAKHQDKLNGSLNESIQDNNNLQKKLASGDKIDQASVMESLSPLAKLETLEAASRSITKKGLDELSGVSLAAVEATGIASAKEIQLFMKLKQGIMQGQEELISRVGQNQMKPGDMAQISKLGIKDYDKMSKEDLAKEIRKKFEEPGGSKLFMKSLDKTQQELLMSSAKEIDYQKETASFQTSMLDKIGILTDALLNWIFGILSDIYDWLLDLGASMMFGGETKQTRFKKAQVAATRGGDQELQNIFATSGGELGKARNRMVNQTSGRALESMKAAKDEVAQLRERLATGKDDDASREAVQKRLSELTSALEGMEDFGTNIDGLKKRLRGMDDPQAVELLSKMLKVGKSSPRGGATAAAAPDSGPFHGAAATAAAAAPATGAAAAPVAAPAMAATARAAENAPTATDQQATTASVDQLKRAVANDGVKLAPASVTGLGDKMADSVYVGSAKALFEYYMYSGLNRSAVAGALGAGVSPAQIAQGVTAGAMTTGATPEQMLGTMMEQAKKAATERPHALGGTVTGIMNGMAQVRRPAPGEGFASIGRGETILPAGGGGGGTKIQLELKGDFRRFIHARVVEGAAAHDRNRRLR